MPRPKQPLRDITGTQPAIQTKATVIPSSLPPSSPLTSSSRPPEANLRGFDNDHPSSLPILSTDDNAQQFEWDDDIALGQMDSGGNSDVSNQSDPFGFFALEEKLKVQRSLALADEKERGRLVFERHVNQSTPVKRTGKRRAMGSYGRPGKSLYSPRTSSMPSTPSPHKPPTKRKKEIAAPKDGSETSDVAISKGSKKSQVIKEGSIRTPGTTPRAARTTRERPIRRAAIERKQIKKSVNKIDSTLNDTQVVRKRRAVKRSGKQVVADRNDKRQVKSVCREDLDCCDAVEHEKRGRERQARVEYFKKLRDYQIEKENVYII